MVIVQGETIDLKSALKICVNKITTASFKERQHVLRGMLWHALDDPGLQDSYVKGIAKILGLTIHRYGDRPSRNLVLEVIEKLIKNHGKKASMAILSEARCAVDYINTGSSRVSASAVSLVLLTWSSIVCNSISGDSLKDEDLIREVVQLESICYSIICSSKGMKSGRIKKGAQLILKTVWQKNADLPFCYLDFISKFPSHKVEDLCYVGLILDHLSETKAAVKLDPALKKCFLDMYVQSCIQTKTCPPSYCLVDAMPVLKFVGHNEFKELVPVIQKSLLRSPEIILEAVGQLIIGLPIDLSQYVDALIKSVAAHLRSHTDSLRNQAVAVIENLARQCSDVDAVEALITYLIAVLNGSEGKLTLPEQRSCTLLAVELCVNASVSGGPNMEKLASAVFESLKGFLLEENHEGTLLQALRTLKTWAKYFTTSLPSSFIDTVKKNVSLKSSSAIIRAHYFQVAGEAIRGNTLHQGLHLLDTLLQAVEKSKSQSSIPANVLEALSAATLVLRLATLDDLGRGKLDNFWHSILDPSKRLLITEKFLLASRDEDLQQLLIFMNLLFQSHGQQMNSGKMKPWYHALVVVLLHSGYQLQLKAKSLLEMIFASGDYDINDFQMKLFEELQKIVVEHHDAHRTGGEMLKVVPVKTIAHVYFFIACCGKAMNSKKEDTLVAILLDTHHPLLVLEDKKLWTKIAKGMGVDVACFVGSRKLELVKLFLNPVKLEESHLNAVATLIAVNPEEIMPIIMENVLSNLANPALSHVTNRDFGIMNTTDGELYDQSIIESARASERASQVNMKRESKAYSFKEQKIDLEIKEELRKKKGDSDQLPQLTPKQKEMLEAQRHQEKEIRMRLLQLKDDLQKHTDLLSKCLDGDAKFLIGYIDELIRKLLLLTKSVLAAPYAVSSFMKVARSVFTGELVHLGDLLGHVSMRLFEPLCKLDPDWCVEEIHEQTVRALETLFSFGHERNVYVMMTYTRKRPFSAGAFTYCLPFLKRVLKERGCLVHGDEGLRIKALQIIQLHSKLRASMSVKGAFDENSPDLLPLADMMQILSEVIVACDHHAKDGKVQQFANTVFDDVCKAGSGDIGCAVAGCDAFGLLMDNLISHCSTLRNASLKGLLELVRVFPDPGAELYQALARRIMIARNDANEDNAIVATRLWEDASLSVHASMGLELLEDIVHPLPEVRLSSCLALAATLVDNSSPAHDIVLKLMSIYEEKMKIPPPVIDNLGRVVSVPFIDPVEARCGVGLALEKICESIDDGDIEMLFKFFVPTALGDRSELVRKQMLNAALETINKRGEGHMKLLLSIFEEFLDRAPDSSAHDAIRQSVIILTGSLAKHLDKADTKIKPIFKKLMGALSTPSQQVQEAVANCLPPLCAAVKDEAPERIKELLNLLLESESYGERRGAAYGLAGLVKGLGILVLKQQNIITILTESIQDKKVWRHREGALFAFETLCSMLGRLFEPYVVHLLPHLLLCFGDGNQYVREAADETAKAVMRNLSSHGVKLVLPSLLKALEEDSWRTKTGSVELLGAMSFCAPKQLSSCLPSIVPRLAEVLADSHIKVQKAGQQALQQIGGVIRNPEIQEIAAIILDALSDPASKTVPCLQALLSTSFVHFIDAPSLSLIMPTLQNALSHRSTETKKMAAQILGNMYALTDPKDLAPYLAAVVPGLKKSLLDPSPEVRAVSARALGATVKGMGEDCFNDLMPWLLETLTSEASSVDRSGAAQGLAEVLHALGSDRLDKLMPDVIATTLKTELSPNVRDGYLMLYIYLPATFGNQFLNYISSIIPPILQGLADESEFVRDTSLKAGQRIISMYSDSAIELLLPELEAGLFDEHWRIRYSSVQLLGDLLFRITGVTGKQTTISEEDDNFGTAHQAQAITDTLGRERRDRVLAGLYMGRSDVALMVRQAALHVWKVIVQNTARTLREILSTLFSLLLGALASKSYDKRQIAARTLGDLVRKLGERVLPEIIPILEAGLKSERGDERQGVCIGLREIMESTSRDMVVQFEDSLINTVRLALMDELAEVRLAAALTFENLHNAIGHKALEGILPSVFEKLDDPALSEYALDGLKQVMAVKSKSVLPFLVPKLTAPPVNTKALAILSSVAGEALVKHLEKILPAMIKAVNDCWGTQHEEQELEGTKALVLSVEDEVGVRVIIDELIAAAKSQVPGIRRICGILLTAFCKSTHVDYESYIPTLMRVIIQLMNDVDDSVAAESWSALDALIKRLDPAGQIQHLGSLRQALRFIKDDIRNGLLPGFCLDKKGISPVLPIFREGILNGSQEVKEHAAIGLGEVIQLTSAEALKPSVVNITGPLIRILGDRFNWNVKVAILDTLGLLLEKVGIMLKPFLPQLQTTFIKALNDPTQAVRQKAAWALGLLTVLHTRVDSLFTELKNGVSSSEDSAVRETILQALRRITLNAGSKMSEPIRKTLLETLLQLITSPEDCLRVSAGGALGALCQVLSEAELKDLLKEQLLCSDSSSGWTITHGRAVSFAYALFDAPEQLMMASTENILTTAALEYAENDRIPICTYGVYCLGNLLLYSAKSSLSNDSRLWLAVAKNLQHPSSDVKVVALLVLKYIAKTTHSFTLPVVKSVICELVALLRDRGTSVRSLSEVTLAFVLQLDKNDHMYEEVCDLPAVANSLQEFKRIALPKINDALGLDKDAYVFIT